MTKKIFEQTIIAMYGDNGCRWIQSLPSIITELAEKWDLSELKPMPNLSYNYVLAGTRKDIPVILKLGNSITFDASAIAREAETLTLLAGPCVRVLDRDDEHGALLLERLQPGIMLKELFSSQDREGVAITSTIIKSFKRVKPASPLFRPIADILTVLDKDWPQLGQHGLKARALRTSLLATTSENVLLHGDLHHENILKHGNSWSVIDPKGFVGDPAYECCAYIRNPIPELLAHHNILQLIKSRIQLFAELLNLDEQRIAQWSYVQAVVAVCWIIEDHLAPCDWIALCDILGQIV